MVALFRRQRETARLDDELQFHLEQQTQENLAGGMTPEDARTAALRSFGNPTQLREEARSHWSWNSLERFWRDVRYGVRTLRRSPGFAIVAVLVMALGIGATASLFTIVHAVLLKPLPFENPDKLVMVYEHFRDLNDGSIYNVVSPGDYADWRNKTSGFEDMAAWRHWKFNLSSDHGDLPEVVEAAAGTWNLLPLLGVKPALGRWFMQQEDRVDGDTAMITWSLFQRRFGGDPSIIGRVIRLDAKPYTVVGVLPSWFAYPDARVQLWVPYASVETAEGLLHHDRHQSYVVARLKSGLSAAAATSQVAALQNQLHAQYPGLPVAEDALSRPMIDDVVQDVKTPLLAMLGAVICLLLIACLNVSNLLVARGAARRKELAIRGAMGGSRLRLIREQMVESFLISLAGGALGVLMSIFATAWLTQHWQEIPRAGAVRVDWTVLLFSLGLVFFAAIMAGLLPAMSSTGKSVYAGLQEGSRNIGGSVSRATLRKTLLTAEIALTVILLVASGLLFKSFLRLRSSEIGAATDRMLTMSYSLPEKQYTTPGSIVAFHEQLLERVRHLPGVLAAGLGTVPPGAGYGGDDVFTIAEHPRTRPAEQDDAIYRMADPRYFSALKIPLVRGRFFTDQDRLDRSDYIIISQQLAREFFSGENPIGQHMNVAFDRKPKNYEIVGVVGDTLYQVGKPSKATMYFPAFSGVPDREMSLIVRTAGDPLAMALPIQKQIAQLDAGLPVSEVLTMQDILGRSTLTASFSATLALAFAAISLLLAAVGLYGVLSYLVTQRVTEIGIRIALGAPRSRVLRLVLRDGLQPVFAGLLMGLAGGVAISLLIRSLLYETHPLDAGVMALVVVSLLLTAALACAIPALRATGIDPMRALRTE